MDEKLNSRLFDGMTEKEKQDFIAIYKDTKFFRSKLVSLLTKAIDNAIIREEGAEFYHKPDVAVNLAYNGGYRAGIKFALSLLTPYLKVDHDQ